MPGTWHSSAACQHICTWIAGERVATATATAVVAVAAVPPVYMEIFYVHVYLHALEILKKKRIKSKKKVVAFGAKKGALYENCMKLWRSYGPQMAINLPDAESNSLAVWNSELQFDELWGSKEEIPLLKATRKWVNFKAPLMSLVGKIASGPYLLSHERSENKIVWQLPAHSRMQHSTRQMAMAKNGWKWPNGKRQTASWQSRQSCILAFQTSGS